MTSGRGSAAFGRPRPVEDRAAFAERGAGRAAFGLADAGETGYSSRLSVLRRPRPAPCPRGPRAVIEVALVVHVLICVALVAVVLLQRSEGGGLGIGGGGGAGGGMMTGRGAGSMLTTVTMWLAAGFFAVSLFLAIVMSTTREPASILDRPAQEAPSGPAAPLGQ